MLRLDSQTRGMATRTLRMFLKCAVFAFVAFSPLTSAAAEKPTSKGTPAAEDLKVYYEIYGKGDPIVVMAGGFGVHLDDEDIGPLSRERQVIGIELEGHGHTALRKDTDEPRDGTAMTSPRCSVISRSRKPMSRATRTAATRRSAWRSSTRRWCAT